MSDVNKRLEVLATEFTVDGRRNRFPAAKICMAGDTSKLLVAKAQRGVPTGLQHPLSPLGYDRSEVCEFLVLQITVRAAIPHCLHLMRTECSPEAVGFRGGATWVFEIVLRELGADQCRHLPQENLLEQEAHWLVAQQRQHLLHQLGWFPVSKTGDVQQPFSSFFLC